MPAQTDVLNVTNVPGERVGIMPQANLNPQGDKEEKLTPKQALFVEAYTSPGTPTFGNQTRSAQAAGYGTTTNSSAVQGHELLNNPKVMNSISAILDKSGATQPVLASLMLKYAQDEDKTVRASSVRAGITLMQAQGMLNADVNVNVDARTLNLSPESLDILEQQLLEGASGQ